MRYLPIFKEGLDLPSLVIGGGPVAERKVAFLLRAGATITVVAPEVTPALTALAGRGKITLHRRAFEPEDLAPHAIIFSATGDREIDRAAATMARGAGKDFCAVDNPAISNFIVPAVVDRDPVLVAVSTGGTLPPLAREIRSRVETMLPRNIGALALKARVFRDALKSRHSGGRDRRQILTRLARRLLAGGPIGEDPVAAGGRVSIVGAGPGDPDLLTLKALQRLHDADVVLFDRLVSPEILDYARRDAERIDVGKSPGGSGFKQEEINALMAHRASLGEHVVRLKGGDPFIFGRGGEEQDYLIERGIAVDIVPGITAALGCAAAEGISLTRRGTAQSVTLLTGTAGGGLAPQEWAALARAGGTLVAYMGASNAEAIAAALIAGGLPGETPVAIIENGARENSRRLNGTLGMLGDLAGQLTARAPALLVIGEVTRERLQKMPEALAS